jgi:pilus assembly protein CpaE
MAIKVLLLAAGRDGLAEILRQLPPADESMSVSQAVGGVLELSSEIENNLPELVVADLPALDDAALAMLERALLASPATALILQSPDRSPDSLIRGMRAGVREMVPSPAAGGELAAALGRQLARLRAKAGVGRQGRVLAFLPSKGGAGSTFVATNLAYALADRGQRVALLDLNLHFGDAVLYLTDTSPTQTIADLAREAARLDGTFLEASMLALAPNLWILPAPDNPELAIEVLPEAVDRIVSLAKARYDFVILDIGRVLEANTLRALDHAEQIFVTVQTILPFLHDAKRLIALLGQVGFPRDRIRLLVNRWEKSSEISITDIRQALGVEVECELPNSFAVVARSINQGVPVLKGSPKDPIARSLAAFAGRLAPQPAQRRRGWFGR